MGNFISYPIEFDNFIFKLNALNGALLKFPNNPNNASKFLNVQDVHLDLPPKVQQGLEQCRKPYTLGTAASSSETIKPRLAIESRSDSATKIAKRMTALCAFNFMLARMYALKSDALFTSARDAVEFYRMNAIGDQGRLCLPRALFAAKTSARFKEKGVLFIGVFYQPVRFTPGYLRMAQ